MTKIIFLTLGTKGDIFPFLGIALEFKKRGYPTLILSSENYRALCKSHDLEFESIQSDAEQASIFLHPDFWKPLKGQTIYLTRCALATAESAYFAIERQAKAGRCALVTNNVMLGGLLAQEKLGLPTASVFLHPFSHVSALDPAKDTPWINALFGLAGPWGRRILYNSYLQSLNSHLSPINVLRKKIGLNPIKDIMGTWRHSVPLMLDLWPEWFSPGKPDWPKHAVRTGFVAYEGAHENWEDRLGLGNFLETKPIVFTLGSGMMQDFEAQAALFSKVCKTLGRTGLMVSPAASGSSSFEQTSDFKAVQYAPFSNLFQQASMIVTHGGIGTIAKALSSGNPAVIAPLAFDQFDNGHRVEKLGTGVCLPFRSLSVGRLAEALKGLSSQKTQQACRTVADKARHELGAESAAEKMRTFFNL